MTDVDERERGLYRKYELYRVDETATNPYARLKLVTDPYFVLRYTTDPHAAAALEYYAASCAATHPPLAADLRKALGIKPCDCGNEAHSSWCDDNCASRSRNVVQPDVNGDVTEQLRAALADLVSPDDCQFDHDGDCQAHGFFGGRCGHAVAKELLARLENR